MVRTRQIARRAARRRRWRRFVSLGGPMLLLTTSAGAAAALADRVVGPGVEWWHWVAWPIVTGAGVASILALARRQSPDDAAVEVDTSMRLNDRLASAMALESRAADDTFAALAIEESERAAAGVDVPRAIRVTWGRSWSLWPLMALVAGAVGYFVEPMRLLDSKPLGSRARFNEREAEAARESIERAAQAVKPEDGRAPEHEAEDKRLQVLDQLAHELGVKSRPPEEALAEAAKVLEEAAADAGSRAERSRAAADELSRSLAQLPADDSPEASDAGETPPRPEGLRESLRRGELGSAAESLEELRRQMENMPRSQREAMAQELDRLADDLERQAEVQREESRKRGERSRDSLLEQGLNPEQAQPLTEQSDEQKIAEALRKEGFSDEATDRLAKELAEENRRREAEQKAAADARKLSEAAEKAAEQLRESTKDQSPAPPEPEKPAGDQSSKGGSSSEPKPQPESKEGAKPDPQPREQPSSEQDGKPRPGEQPSKTQPTQGGERGEKSDDSKGEPKPDSSPSPAPGLEAPGAPRQGQEGGKPEASKPDASQEPKPGEHGAQPAPGTEPGAEEPGKSSDGSPPPSIPDTMPSPDAIKNMQKLLQEMDKQQQQGQSEQKRSEELRQQAKKLLEQASPEQREQMMKWAQQQMREQGEKGEEGGKGGRQAGSGKGDNRPDAMTGSPFRTEDVDARRTGAKERIAAEWTRPGVAQPDRAISTREFEQQLQDAQEAAQQAMEEQTIPARYRNVQEFYKRALKKQPDTPAPAPAPAPTPDAKDAKKP
ncbi:MAG: hypothetical protein JNK58_13575 [Phycisphaerae bacterium]|nr:hypothetical protein [Phycisphaerae bacterium]